MRSAKILNLVVTVAIVAFWLLMNARLVRRDLEFRDLSAYRQGMVNYLGQELRRERWLGIYKTDTHEKIGYTGLIFEKLFDDDGIEHRATIDSYLVFDLFGKGNTARIRGEVVSDNEMLPLSLDLDIDIDGLRIRLTGEREERGFALRGKAGAMDLGQHMLPLRELFPSDGFFPTLPVSGFEVGQTYDVPMFDPLFQSTSEASVEVVEKKTTKELDEPSFHAMNMECYILETRFRGMTYESVVTPDGEVLVQTIPSLEVKLKREKREHVKNGVRVPTAAPGKPRGETK